MAKRFTDTEKWRDSWFQGLSAEHKLAMFYILDNCDAAGVFDPNTALAEFCMGQTVDWKAFLAACGKRIVVLPSGLWHVTKFVSFQYGELSEGCKPHAKVLQLLKKHRVSKGYPKGIHTQQEEEEDKEEEKDRGGAGEIYEAYPRKVAKQDALRAIERALEKTDRATLLERTKAYAAAVALWPEDDRQYVPHPATWFNRGSYDDDPETWQRKDHAGANGRALFA